jgi:hypothetical protein
MKFGVREIVDVVFKATANGQRIGNRTFKKYQPVFMIDTATTSSLEQATTTVYAQGGKGYARLIAWEGEKTMTFTVTDALMSPMGLAVLTGAGLINPVKGSSQTHVHTTLNVPVDSAGNAVVTVADLNEEFGLNADDYVICKKKDVGIFATELDGSGAGINWFGDDDQNPITVEGGDSDSAEYVHIVEGGTPATFNIPGAADTTVQLDFYTIMNNSVTEVQIEPNSFGGYFYIEAQTLFRREDTGKDMAAEIIIPKAKVQSAFTFTMAASGDPSTFDFVMDAFPGYTKFDSTKKQMCVIQIVGDDKKAEDETGAHTHDALAIEDSPSFYKTFDISGSTKVPATKVPTTFADATECKENQNKVTVTMVGSKMNVSVAGGVDSLNEWTSTDPGQATYGDKPWIALDVDTGTDDITKVKYNGYALTSSDVADATAWGLDAGHFILWIKADDVKTTPKAFTLSTEGYEDTTVTISVVDAD